MKQIVLDIVKFYEKSKRDMPWRNTNNPYYIWLSEIILQQTQVKQGTAYYEKFIAHFPTIIDLANANEENVLKLWQGLGYYSRARNLHKTARIVAEEYNGIFPKEYTEIIALPGIGEYTAAAISSFAYNKPYPVLDGNVFRFLSRFYGIYLPINEQKSRKEFMTILNEFIAFAKPKTFNNAIMEMGAIICKPDNPQCNICVVNSQCYALKQNAIKQLPVKNKTLKIKTRFLNFIFIEYQGYFYLTKRQTKDIWQNLHTLPMIETITKPELNEINKKLSELINNKIIDLTYHKHIKHLLTHQILEAQFYTLKLSEKPNFKTDNYTKVDMETYKNFSIPKLIDKYLLLL